MIPSTKFWTAIFAMLCVTVIEAILVYQHVYDYLDWYFGFMVTMAGGYTLSKYTQNIALAGMQVKPKEVKEQ